MPRVPRLDYPGALHHIIVRGIERRKIFRSNYDRRDFLNRLGHLVIESRSALYAWALMPNHAHLLLRTQDLSLSALMHRFLTGYVRAFNPRHRRCGHLFHSRFKNILVEEEPYFLELIRYIHLNPVRAALPVTIDSLDRYAWTGHAVLLGWRKFPAQNTDFVLSHFGRTRKEARRAYRRFILEGLNTSVPDLDGGGLRRSAGGWELIPKLRRGREKWAYDERILGSSEFVSETLSRLSPHQPLRPTADDIPAILDDLCLRAALHIGISKAEIISSTQRRDVTRARTIICQIAVREHGLSMAVIASHLNISPRSVSRALHRPRASLPANIPFQSVPPAA